MSLWLQIVYQYCAVLHATPSGIPTVAIGKGDARRAPHRALNQLQVVLARSAASPHWALTLSA
ncbi:MAG TPA: hypothetical protein VKP30_26760 [Polyangiaceae bacterium]|nr:hypothetical protein [Polyangiaceae bacterium]